MIKSESSYHHGNLRSALLEIAEQQLQDVGVESLSLRALARSLGVSQTAPYRHFEDKKQLLVALATKGYRELFNLLTDASNAKAPNPEAQMRALAHSYINFSRVNPELFKLMFGPSLEPMDVETKLRAVTRETFHLVRSIMEAGINNNDFRDCDVDYLSNSAWSSIYGLAILAIDSPELFERHIELRKQVDFGVDILIAGLRPSGQ